MYVPVKTPPDSLGAGVQATVAGAPTNARHPIPLGTPLSFYGATGYHSVKVGRWGTKDPICSKFFLSLMVSDSNASDQAPSQYEHPSVRENKS